MMEKREKIILRSFLVINLILLTSLIFTLFFLGKAQKDNYNELTKRIEDLNKDTQSKINTITDSLSTTKDEVNTLESTFHKEINSLSDDLSLLKSTAGEDFSGIIENSIKSVVTIKTDISQGTGFIINDGGYVITNYHVIEGASKASIYTSDQQSHIVYIIGSDSEMDITLLRINGTYQKLDLAESSEVKVGEKVIAIGNPLGLQFSVTEGIISALNRIGPNGKKVYIQIDASLNPGNSGGPLINKKGKVVGINNFKIGSGESLGFALESDSIKEVVNRISKEELNITIIS